MSTQNLSRQSAKLYLLFSIIPTKIGLLLCNKSMILGPPMIYYTVRKTDNKNVLKNPPK